MQAKLEFNLDSTDDESNFRLCSQAVQMSLVIYDLDEYLRKLSNNDNEETPEQEREFAQKIRDFLRESVMDREIKGVLY